MDTDIDAIQKAALAANEPHRMEKGGAFMVVPDGYRIEDIERFLERPSRIRAAVGADTVEAFIAYFNRYAADDKSMVFASVTEFRLLGALDWHAPGAPEFAAHKVQYEAPRAPEWETWTGRDGEIMTQIDFAQFIEENLPDIREPAGAEVLEVSQRLEAKKKVEFVSATRLSDGARDFTYTETVDGTTQRGQIKVPESFTLGIPVFVDGPAYAVEARLRYRIVEGALKLWYDMVHPRRVERDAFDHIVDEVRSKVTVPVLAARPA